VQCKDPKHKTKEKLPPFSNYDGGLQRRQPGAKTIAIAIVHREKRNI